MGISVNELINEGGTLALSLVLLFLLLRAHNVIERKDAKIDELYNISIKRIEVAASQFAENSKVLSDTKQILQKYIDKSF